MRAAVVAWRDDREGWIHTAADSVAHGASPLLNPPFWTLTAAGHEVSVGMLADAVRNPDCACTSRRAVSSDKIVVALIDRVRIFV